MVDFTANFEQSSFYDEKHKKEEKDDVGERV